MSHATEEASEPQITEVNAEFSIDEIGSGQSVKSVNNIPDTS
jgi:hypothetical protein